MNMNIKMLLAIQTENQFQKDDLVKRILQASKRVKSGKFISQESLENEVANW
jgi:hypothetical protein